MFFFSKKAVEKKAAFEPGEPLDKTESPVAWVSRDVWQRRQQWSRFPELKSADDELSHLFDVNPAVVDDRWRQSRSPNASRPAAPAAMSLEEAQRAIDQTEDVAAFWNPVNWPMCCGALTVLILVNPTRDELVAAESRLGSLDGACATDNQDWNAELGAIRAGEQPENGVNVFQCGSCGRSYGYHSHT